MNHTVYTRFNYPDDPELARVRLRLASKTAIPSFMTARAWAAKPVRWVWWASPPSRMAIIDEVRLRGYQGEIHVLPHGSTLEDDDLQTTLDSDDILGTHLLDRAQWLFGEDDGPGEAQLVTHPFILLDYDTGHRYRPAEKVSAENTSRFYSILHPTPEVHVYCAPRPELAELCPSRLDSFLAGNVAVIHDHNHELELHPDAERIG